MCVRMCVVGEGVQYLAYLYFVLCTLYSVLHAAARSHVNRLCLAADVPLIESGSAGYQGQVTVIRKVGRWGRWCSEHFPICSLEILPPLLLKPFKSAPPLK